MEASYVSSTAYIEGVINDTPIRNEGVGRARNPSVPFTPVPIIERFSMRIHSLKGSSLNDSE